MTHQPLPAAVPKVQSWAAFKDDLRKAARGQGAPADAGGLVVESVDALLRLLTTDNRELLRIIRDEHPPSIAALSKLTHRAQPNLARTLGKLEAAGLVTFRQEGKRRVPVALARKFRVEVDPFAAVDRIEVT